MPNTEPAASKADIFDVMEPLMRTMPSKGKVDDRMEGYFIALAGFTRKEIERGVRRFMSGSYEGVRSEFVPPPPQMAQIVRGTAERDHVAKPGSLPKFSGFNPPVANILERRITKQDARQLVDDGVHPKGSIWCPGPLGENDHHLGDLYGPDPAWEPAHYLGEGARRSPFEVRLARGRQAFDHQAATARKPKVQAEPEAPPEPTIHDYSQETEIEITPEMQRWLEQQGELR